MFLKNRNIIFKMKISKVTDYAALMVKGDRYGSAGMSTSLCAMRSSKVSARL